MAQILPYVRKGDGKINAPREIRDPRLSFSPPANRPLTLINDPVDSRDYQLSDNIDISKVAASLPLQLDHTPKMSPVKDQGQLGSCVGFAAVAMKEWQERREHELEIKEGKRDHRKGKEYDYSEAWLYWNCKKIDGHSGGGTYVRCAMKVLERIGVPTEKAWPYSDDKLNIGKPASWAPLISRWALGGDYYRITGINQAKVALREVGPFICGVPVYYDFFFVKGQEIIPMPTDGEKSYGGHAICIVGYDDERQVLKFKNSWSTGWGDNGYGYLSYKYFNEKSWSNWVCKDIKVTTEMVKEARSLIE